jgi:hypothetical protein
MEDEKIKGLIAAAIKNFGDFPNKTSVTIKLLED